MHCFYYRIGDDQNTNLQNWCPYGNYLFKEADYPVPKNVYTKEFLYLGCDITKDSSEVHLSKVCNKHKHCLKCATLPKTSGWKRKCLSIAGPDQSKVDIKAYPKLMKLQGKMYFKLQSMSSQLSMMLTTFLGL